jgi:hypothetical protein
MSRTEQEIEQIRTSIAEVYARRERLKQELETGAVPTRDGFTRLDEIDRELSELDSRFKQLWDATRASSAVVPHPASDWARGRLFEPIHLDCVTAIMLKILDAKCKMGEAEKTALAAVYDEIKDRSGQTLDASVHDLIASARLASARDVSDAAPAEHIHAWRVRAEAHIPKPVMKDFKQLLRASLPMH